MDDLSEFPPLFIKIKNQPMKIFRHYELQNQLIKVFWITVGWTIFSVFQFLIGLSVLKDLNCEIGKDDPIFFFKGSLLTGVLAGVIGGSGLVFLWEKTQIHACPGAYFYHLPLKSPK